MTRRQDSEISKVHLLTFKASKFTMATDTTRLLSDQLCKLLKLIHRVEREKYKAEKIEGKLIKSDNSRKKMTAAITN